MSQHDAVVIGGGAAGLSAALVLSRARRRVLVVDAGSPRNAPAAHMHGFLSRDGLPPGELLAYGRNEVKNYGGEIIAGTVTALVPDGRTGFWVLLGDGQRISARRLLVTTATSYRTSPVCVSGGPATSCTVRTATDTRFATAGSVC